MGICQSTDIAQEIMAHIFHDMDDIKCYLDDIGIFTDDYASHMVTIHVVLTCLQDNGFSINC
jgi:hypothetical protein